MPARRRRRSGLDWPSVNPACEDTAPTPPPRRIVLVSGPSGSGKSVLTRRAGLPVVPLDDFYYDAGHPGLPHRFGIVDWDDPRSWDADAALAALMQLARRGAAEVPIYSISRSARIGRRTITAGDAPVVLAEGIFAAELVAPLAAAGLLADALVIDRPVLLVLVLRLVRDLREARKPPLTLLRRGLYLAGRQREDVARLIRAGMRPVGLRAGVRHLRRLALISAAEQHQTAAGRTARRGTAGHRAAGHRAAGRSTTGRGLTDGGAAGSGTRHLRIAAVCFLRPDANGAHGLHLLAVRKRGTSSFMQVGGKIEPGESGVHAAVREVAEEIGVQLHPAELEELGRWQVPAANEPGVMIDADVFLTRRELPEGVVVHAEIAEARWFPLAAGAAADEAGAAGAAAGAADAHLAPLMTERIMPALRKVFPA